MLPVLLCALLVTLLFGVGWTVGSRLRTRIVDLEHNAAAVEQSFVRDDQSIVDLYNRVEALQERLMGHECKPSAAAHSTPKRVQGAVKLAGNSVAKKAAPVKKAAAKKAPVRAR